MPCFSSSLHLSRDREREPILPLAPGAHAHETRNARRRRSSARLIRSFGSRSSASFVHIRGPPKHLTDPCRPHRKRHRDAPAGRPDRCRVIKYLAGPGVFFPRCHTLFSFGYSRDHVGRTSSRASRGGDDRCARAGPLGPRQTARAGSAPGATSRASEHSACAQTLDRTRGGAFNTHMSTELHLSVSPSRRICGP